MSSNGFQPGGQGIPAFPNSDGFDLGADSEELARYAAFRGNVLRGSTAARDAFEYPVEGLWWSNTSTGGLDRYNGTAWVSFARAAGSVTCPATAGGGSAPVYWSDLIDVTFPTGRFTAPPRVWVQTVGPAGQVPLSGMVEQITASGCKVRGMRFGSVPSTQFSVQWFAVA